MDLSIHTIDYIGFLNETAYLDFKISRLLPIPSLSSAGFFKHSWKVFKNGSTWNENNRYIAIISNNINCGASFFFAAPLWVMSGNSCCWPPKLKPISKKLYWRTLWDAKCLSINWYIVFVSGVVVLLLWPLSETRCSAVKKAHSIYFSFNNFMARLKVGQTPRWRDTWPTRQSINEGCLF